MDEWEPQPRMECRLSPQEVVLVKKKKKKSFAGSSMLSEALRHQTAWQISLPVGLVCVRRYTHNLYMEFFPQRSVRQRPLSARCWVLLTVRGQNRSAGDTDVWLTAAMVICLFTPSLPKVRFSVPNSESLILIVCSSLDSVFNAGANSVGLFRQR